MKRIIFASSNKGKFLEVSGLLNLSAIKLITLSDLPEAQFPEVEESGNSFRENALIKAHQYFDILKEPVITDDSGLIVPELNGEPGIFSARYAGPNASDEENNNLLLHKMKNIEPGKRNAFFQAVVVYKDKFQEISFEGVCEGRIIDKPIGSMGFGYDPIFFVKEAGKTYAELALSEKNKYSHRGKAITKLKAFLEKQKGADF